MWIVVCCGSAAGSIGIVGSTCTSAGAGGVERLSGGAVCLYAGTGVSQSSKPVWRAAQTTWMSVGSPVGLFPPCLCSGLNLLLLPSLLAAATRWLLCEAHQPWHDGLEVEWLCCPSCPQPCSSSHFPSSSLPAEFIERMEYEYGQKAREAGMED